MKARYVPLILVIGLGLLAGNTTAADFLSKDKLVIVANADLEISSIDAAKVKSVFLGRTSEVNGNAVEVTILKSGIVHYSFLKLFIKKTPIKFIYLWKQLVFAGKARMPKSFNSEAEMVKYIAEHPSAIGYISAKTAQDSSIITNKVKTFAIK